MNHLLFCHGFRRFREWAIFCGKAAPFASGRLPSEKSVESVRSVAKKKTDSCGTGGIRDPAARAGLSHRSGAAVAHGDVFPLHDHRHFPLPSGKFQHLIELFGLLLDVDVPVALVRLTGAAGVGSPRLAVDHDFFRHGFLLHLISAIVICMQRGYPK